MIGVVADPADRDAVREFFELFKTPWEFHREGGRYDVLLCAGDGPIDDSAKLLVLYSGRRTNFDDEQKIPTSSEQRQACILSYQGYLIPVYGHTVSFPVNGSKLLTAENSEQCLAYLNRSSERTVARIGYDLFNEVRTLLEVGQPVANASMPALELHIALLRGLITGNSVPLVEIPPTPAGYQFIACLTHDVDHPSIRRHTWDHTMFGFLFRAVFGSLRRFIRGQMPSGDLFGNWLAALKLPLVYLRLAKDFWLEFADRYRELEREFRSTFFLIPFKNRPGDTLHGPAPARRAARYGAADITDEIRKLMIQGCEIGLHGIDTWLDSSRGRAELEEIKRLTGSEEIGVRMHWLYYGQQSPTALEKAGASYDSTLGYNETVGYRAGTTQAFKPLQATQLLELPLHVMDTALFYPSYLALSPRQARARLSQMIENAARFGGCLTINWHDRSVAPERLWGACYRDLIQDLRNRGAWVSTAGQAVSWFRKRRTAVFEPAGTDPMSVRAKVAFDQDKILPGLRLRIHKPRELDETAGHNSEHYGDTVLDQGHDTRLLALTKR